MAPPNPTIPATDPTERPGTRSVGRIITSVDHDCCPKNATLNVAIARSTGALSTNKITGMIAALHPKAHLRAAFTDNPRRNNQLENHPPVKLPNPDAAYGIQA